MFTRCTIARVTRWTTKIFARSIVTDSAKNRAVSVDCALCSCREFHLCDCDTRLAKFIVVVVVVGFFTPQEEEIRTRVRSPKEATKEGFESIAAVRGRSNFSRATRPKTLPRIRFQSTLNDDSQRN